MKKRVSVFLGLAGASLATAGAATLVQAAEKPVASPKYEEVEPYRPRRQVQQSTYAPPYYSGSYGYNYQLLPVYTYGRGPNGMFNSAPDAPGGLLNPGSRPVEQPPQQWMMNQPYNRPLSDNEPY